MLKDLFPGLPIFAAVLIAIVNATERHCQIDGGRSVCVGALGLSRE
jgi:hypothetical protein